MAFISLDCTNCFVPTFSAYAHDDDVKSYSLDEPTNHLDLEAVLWLERYLTNDFRGILVVVSHDRHFLNEVVTDVVHFHQNALTTYRGDISNFTAVREENRKRQIRLYEQQEAKRAHLQKYIDLHAESGENGVKAARQRKSRMKKLDKLGVMAAGEGKKFKASYDGEAKEIEEYKDDEEVVLNFPDPGGFDSNIVVLDQISFGYTSDNILLQNVDLTIDMKSRVALLGRNGCGRFKFGLALSDSPLLCISLCCLLREIHVNKVHCWCVVC